jgi:uncharacterized protein with HEPN domain
MSAIDDKTRLQHILDAGQKIQNFAAEHTRESFEKDEMLQLALVRLIEIIGEAASKISQEFRDEHTTIAWQAIIGMRNRLVHAYFAIDYDIVWNTISIAIPELVKQIKAIQASDE